MSGLKAIRRRIVSVKNTKQITRAMKLVSAAKLRRAQDAALGGRDFARKLKDVLKTVQRELPADFSHPLLQARPVKNRRVIFISGERGLCGPYNTNVVKAVALDALADAAETDYVAVGRRAVAAAKRANWKINKGFDGLPEDASQWPVSDIVTELVQEFLDGKIDEVVLYSTRFVSAMTQVVEKQVILPCTLPPVSAEAGEKVVEEGGVKFDPPPAAILEKLLPLLIRTAVSQAGFEAKASEHAARMTAMDAATNNADDLMSRLRLFYNRARQSTITRELIDIVGGAEAIK